MALCVVFVSACLLSHFRSPHPRAHGHSICIWLYLFLYIVSFTIVIRCQFDVDADIYVKLPKGISILTLDEAGKKVTLESAGKALKLIKALYGLKQAPQLWSHVGLAPRTCSQEH